MRGLRVLVVVMAVGFFGLLAAGAWAAVTPGWECVPTTAGQAVVSGGTGSSPSCGTGTTGVLAPTYVAAGVDGMPTVEFSTVNVQIVDGTGSTSLENGTGNLVLGYNETPGTQTGSHDLVLGEHQTYTGYGDVIGGYGNDVTGHYAAALGYDNKVTAIASSVLGGFKNTVSSAYSSISGGCSNLAGAGSVTVNPDCTNLTGYAHDFASITGGSGDQASSTASSVTGGERNLAGDPFSTISGGEYNITNDAFSWIGAGCDNLTGSGTANTDGCDPGGEALLGGASQTLTGTDTHLP